MSVPDWVIYGSALLWLVYVVGSFSYFAATTQPPRRFSRETPPIGHVNRATARQMPESVLVRVIMQARYAVESGCATQEQADVAVEAAIHELERMRDCQHKYERYGTFGASCRRCGYVRIYPR